MLGAGWAGAGGKGQGAESLLKPNKDADGHVD